MRILIVDDEAVRVPVLTQWLEYKTGGAVDVTHSVTMPDSKVFSEYDIVCLDHDLGPGLNTYDILRRRFLADNIPEMLTAQVIIHSMNPIGAENIRRLLVNDYGMRQVDCYSYRLISGS